MLGRHLQYPASKLAHSAQIVPGIPHRGTASRSDRRANPFAGDLIRPARNHCNFRSDFLDHPAHNTKNLIDGRRRPGSRRAFMHRFHFSTTLLT